MTPRENIKKIKFLLQGISTYVPAPLSFFLPTHQHQFKCTGQRVYSNKTTVARAYYSVWMRMLVTMHDVGVLDVRSLKVVGEIGPGDSLTAGLSAILTGATTYTALDIVPTAHNFDNLEIFEELVQMFKSKTPIPSTDDEPKQRPYLASYAFPSHIISDADLERLLAPERLEKIREAIRSFEKNEVSTNEIQIKLLAPWYKKENLEAYANSFDLIISNAAMEHVADVPLTYHGATKLLKQGGLLSSAIDYKCHDTAGLWNAHWTYSPLMWKLVCGKTAYLINRWTHAMHRKELEKTFNIVIDTEYPRVNLLTKSDIAEPFTAYPLRDLEIAEGYIVAKKR